LAEVKNELSRFMLAKNVVFKNWTNESVIYNEISGDTHLLDKISTIILIEAQKKHLSRDDLFNILSIDIEIDDELEIQLCMDSYILKLSSLGILDTEN